MKMNKLKQIPEFLRFVMVGLFKGGKTKRVNMWSA